MLDVRSRQADIARTAQATGTDAIRQRPLNTGASGIFLRKGSGGLSLPGGLEGFVLFTGANRNRTAGMPLCTRTL
jgi:hypothetical protein